MRIVIPGLLAAVMCMSSAARAEITVQRVAIENSPPVLLLKGEFGRSDDPEAFANEVRATGARVVTFNSDGGSILSAMAYGKAIRALGLSTIQLRAAQCASACALAFVGGVNRQAEPGAIGVHQSSFSPEATIDGQTAVSAIQAVTAQIMTYLIEMGVDPRLLQLSLAVSSDDMRYLTASEMQNYRVTWGRLPDAPTQVPTGSATVAVPTVPAAQSKSPTNGEKALAFVTRYYDEWSKINPTALAYLDQAYSDVVDFYGTQTARTVVMTGKREFAARWPIRAYSVKADSVRIDCSATCRIEGMIDWYARRDAGGRVSSGTAEFAFVWNHAAGKILSEAGTVIETEKDASGPSRLITQWQTLNSLCRGGSGDLPQTQVACDRRETLGRSLQAVGWCYGREGENGYQMGWHACAGVTARATATTPNVRRLSPLDFPPASRQKGETVLPDFKGRDRSFNTFRTRIRDGMRQGPNFNGHYTLIQIGCGTGCSFVVSADNQTGRPSSFPRGGEANMYLQLGYSLGSRLVAAQWFNYESGRCFLEYFDHVNNVWTAIEKSDIGNEATCYRQIVENIP